MTLLGFDVDSTLIRTDLVLLDLIAKKLGYQVSPDLFHTYDIQACCPSLSTEDVNDIIYAVGEMEHTFKIPPYSGAMDFLRWYAKTHPIYIITNRCNTETVYAYLQHHLDKKTYDRVKIFHAKEKGKLAKSLGITHFIEDHILHIVNLANYGIIPIMMEQNWNKKLSHSSLLRDLIYVVRSWEDIYAIAACELTS